MNQTVIEDFSQTPFGTGYFVRIDEHEGYAKVIKDLPDIHTDFIAILAVRHKGRYKENPHYHLVITTDIKLQSFRVRMKKLFTQGKGNGHMSIKVWDGCEKALSYLFHEEDPYVIVQYGYSDDDITRFMSLDQEIKDEYNESKKKTKSSREALIKLTIEKFGTEYPPYLDLKVNLQHNVVAFMVWDICKEHQINLPHKFNLEHIIRTVQMYFAQKSRTSWYGVKEQWYSEMFSFRN